MGQENIYMIVLVGEAGSGKDTIANKLCEALPDMTNKVMTWTTRPKRDYEVQNREYHFATVTEFINERENMIEWDKFNDWFYGTSAKALQKNKVNIGVYTPAGCKKLMEYNDLYPIFFRVSCDSKTRIIRQCERDKNTPIQEICRRFLADANDFDKLTFPYHTLNNNTLQDLENNVADLKFLVKMLYNFMIEEEENN